MVSSFEYDVNSSANALYREEVKRRRYEETQNMKRSIVHQP